MAEGVELAVAYVSIVPEGSKIAPEVRKQFGAAGVEAKRAGRESGKQFGGAFGGGLKLLGGAAVGAGIVGFFKDAIGGASDLNESTTKINAIFGKAEGAVQAFASKGAKSLGQTKLEVLDAAASFGTFGKAAGLQGPKLAKFSTGFAGLSTDLASFFNTDPSQAAEAIGAALRGEAEPIRQFGVLLDDATLRSEALRLGLIKTTKQALTPQQKVLAAQAAIYKQTKDAQGDFARTSGGLANQQRILKAQLSDVRSELGVKLLPAATKAVSGISKFVTGMQEGTGAGGEFADAVKNDLLPVAKSLGREAKVLFSAIKPVLGILKELPPGLVASGGAAGLLGSKLGGLRTPLEANASGFAKLGRAGASLAGGAGLLAIADAAKQTNPALAGLEGAAGGAAIGLAVGGPLGAGLGFVAGGLLGVFSSGKKAVTGLDLAAEAAKQGTPTFSNYATTLNQVSGAITKATKAMVIQDLQQKGLLDTTRELGISDGEVFKGLTGGASARLKLKNDLRDATVQTEFFSDASDSSKVATLRNIQALQGLSGGLQKSQLELLQSNLLQAENKRQADLARGALEKYGRTHAIGTAELFGYTTVKKQVADLKSSLASLFNFAAKGEKAHPELNNHGTSLGDALGLDLLGGGGKKRRKHREFGGPVSRNVAYTVGERRPEVFVPNQSGRIVPKIAAASAVASSGSLSGARLTLHIAGRQIEGVLEEVADSRVDSAAALRGEQDRAFG